MNSFHHHPYLLPEKELKKEETLVRVHATSISVHVMVSVCASDGMDIDSKLIVAAFYRQ
jgi:hypothetical protein